MMSNIVTDRKEYRDTYNRKYYLEHKEELNTQSRQYQLDHQEQVRAHAKMYRSEHQPEIKERRRSYTFGNREEINRRKRESYQLHKDKILPAKLEKYREVRAVCLTAYGGKCTCCGETEYKFLAFDHINNNGGEMRKNKSHPENGLPLYKWLVKNNFPSEFQLLCHNCNNAKGFYGSCPHQDRL